MIDEETLEKILTPISEENPSGEDLLYEGTYDKIQQNRQEDDPSLALGVWQTGQEKKADWNQVRAICIDALENRSKDLKIAVWLTEALFHLDGFTGLNHGLNLVNKLCEAFWDTLYPEIDEDMDFRLSPIRLMNDKLFLSLKFIPITGPPPSEDSQAYHLADMEMAKSQAGELLEAFEKSVSVTPEYFYAELHGDVTSALELLENLGDFLDKKCGKESPSLRGFREVLENIQHFASGKFSAPEPELEEPPGELQPADEEPRGQEPSLIELESEDSGTWSRILDGLKPGKKEKKKNMKEVYKVLSEICDYLLKARPNSPVINLMKQAVSWKNTKSEREEAYEMLSQAADFLTVHEPHSPGPYLVKRAVSWKDKKLEDLLPELIKDDNDLQQVQSLLGLHSKV